jgi:O-antigen ligase
MHRRKKLHCNFSNPLVFALIIYWLVSAISLVAVRPNEVVFSIFHFGSPLIRDFLSLGEGSVYYSWLSFFALTISFIFGFLITDLATSSKKIFTLMGCYLLGLMITVILGLLDYYDAINLNSIRPWYFLPSFGENYRFAHLTSVFGNPGWYAQYLVLGAPALLTVLALNFSRKLKLGILIGLMVITEFCIILIYQRGGWLSYPLTLIIIWFCVYVFDGEGKDFVRHMQAIKGSLLKIAITLPLTIAISLSLVYFTVRNQPENRQQLSGFAQRAESITNVNDRLRYWEPAFLMARLHPLFGSGMESFASQYERLYLVPGHQYVQTPKYDVMPFYGSAHNLYFQTVAGKGFLGLLSLFGIFAAVFTLVWKGIFSPLPNAPALTQPQRLILMMSVAYTCALAIYGNVGEIFYSPIGYIPFVLFYAGSIAAVPPAYRLSFRFRAWVLGFLAVAFVAHLYLEFGARFAR